MISVILPTFNESGSIEKLIRTVHQKLVDLPHEILVVDDNSPDKTYDLVCGLKLDYVRAFLRTTDPSLARSIRHGIENARGDTLVIMDSDFNHDPEYLPFMIQSLSHFDVIMGSRFLYGGRGASESRHVLSWLFNLVLRLISDGRITDSLFGYYVVRRQCLENLNFDEIFTGFGEYSIRLVYFLQMGKFHILQVPTILSPRIAGVGHEQIIRTFFLYSWCTLKIVWRHGRIGSVRKTASTHLRQSDARKVAD